MSIYFDYINYHNKYLEKYGSNTIILMQVGSFFEMYGTDTEGPNMKIIADILNIQCTKKNKSILEVSSNNPYLIGFPCHSLNKFIDIFIENNFTIIMIEQVTPPPSPKREVTRIISPSING